MDLLPSPYQPGIGAQPPVLAGRTDIFAKVGTRMLSVASFGRPAPSPVVSGKGVDPATGKTLSMLPASIDFHWFPLDNPGLVSIPLGFFLGWLGTVTSKEFNEDKYAEMEVRSLTGHGVAEAIDH